MTDSHELYHRFTKLESQLNLFDFEWNGIPVWELVRYKIFEYLACDSGVWSSFQGTKSRPRLNTWKRRLASTRYAHKWFVPWRGCDVLVCGHPRRKPSGSGKWIDIYTDPIRAELENRGVNTAQVERPFGQNGIAHLRPPESDSVRYLELVNGLARMLRSLPLAPPSDFSNRLYEAERSFESQFGTRVRLIEYMWEAYRKFSAQRTIWRGVFCIMRPKLLLLVVGYGKEGIVAAAEESGVVSAELQHGSPSAQKVNSDYDGVTRPRRFATDLYLAFGQYWIDRNSWPLKEDHVVDFGFPYMAEKRAELELGSERDCVLFISQPSVGEVLSSLAVACSRNIDMGRRVVFKLHPAERSAWKSRYPCLVDSEVEVIDDDGEALYQLFRQAYVQVGVYSTALYEGLALGCALVVVNTSGAEFMEDVVNRGWAVYCKGETDIEEAIARAPRVGQMGEYFFSTSWRERLQEVLARAGIE